MEVLMSHIVTIKTEVRDPAAIAAACRRLGLGPPLDGEHSLYSGMQTGIAVRLPKWHYPVVCDTKSGRVRFDNYGGRWGEERELNRFIQAYAVEKAKIEARKLGHNVSEARQADGSILLTINT
jgi:hypothetical protein